MSKLDQLKTRVSYQSLLLAGFALLASAILGIADLNTRDEIKLRLEEDLQASLTEVIPNKFFDNNLLKDTTYINSEGQLEEGKTLVYIARKEGKVSAVSFQVVAHGGYSGDISMIIGIDRDGSILGVRVLAHAETPGLGDKIEVSKADWILDFVGRSLATLTPKEWAVKKDGGVFDQFSGATITPRAVVKGVYRGLEFFRNHQTELLAS